MKQEAVKANKNEGVLPFAGYVLIKCTNHGQINIEPLGCDVNQQQHPCYGIPTGAIIQLTQFALQQMMARSCSQRVFSLSLVTEPEGPVCIGCDRAHQFYKLTSNFLKLFTRIAQNVPKLSKMNEERYE